MELKRFTLKRLIENLPISVLFNESSQIESKYFNSGRIEIVLVQKVLIISELQTYREKIEHVQFPLRTFAINRLNRNVVQI